MSRFLIHHEHPIEITPGHIGATIRRGMKWQSRAVPGTVLELCECTRGVAAISHTSTGEATIIDVWNGRFQDIPAKIIELMDQVKTRQYTPLLHEVRKYFGRDFEEKQYVTVLIYRRTK